MHCKIEVMERKYGMQGTKSQHEEDEARGLLSRLDLLRNSGAFHCADCRDGVGVNSIKCSKCKHWVHKKCSGVRGRLVQDPDYVCPRCCDRARPIDNRPITQVGVDGTLLDVEPSFCYLGHLLCASVGSRCGIVWGKFKSLLPILKSNHVSLRTRRKVFNACVRSALLHGSETWAPTVPDLQRLRRNDNGPLDLRSQRWQQSARGTLCNVRGARGGDNSSPH